MATNGVPQGSHLGSKIYFFNFFINDIVTLFDNNEVLLCFILCNSRLKKNSKLKILYHSSYNCTREIKEIFLAQIFNDLLNYFVLFRTIK